MLQSFAEESMGRRINLLFRLCMTYLRKEMKQVGVGTGDYALLFILFMEDGLSQDELSRRLRVDKSHTARALAKMEKMGMVVRQGDPDRYRAKQVFLSEKALELQANFLSILKTWQQVLVAGIPEQDLLVIRRGLDRMMANAEAYLDLDPLPSIQELGKRS